MSSNISRVGHFTAENITAVLLAIPGTNGTYAKVTENARKQGSNVGKHTVAKWVTQGRRDLAARRDSAYARFTKHYDDRVREHCSPDKSRHREIDRALAILERRCECGNEKPIAPDGSIADQCRRCQELDGTRRGRNGRGKPQTAEAGPPRTGPKS